MSEENRKNDKRYWIIAACTVLALVLIAGAYRMGRSAGNGADIGEETAKLTALGHAQVSESSLTRYEISRDRRDGKAVYEVEFTADGVEYDYEIGAADGSIVKFQKELDGAAAPVETPAGNDAGDSTGSSAGDSTGIGMPAGNTSGTPAKTPSAVNKTGDIGEERAWAAAYAHAGVAAADVTASPVKVDYENGVRVYELEFFSGGYEYDYEISAADGSVLKFEKESVPTAPNQAPVAAPAQAPAAQTSSVDTPPSYIGEARAREIAYAHAGVAASAVGHCAVELDHHDGHGTHHGAERCAYEIDFKCGGYEYDYEVDAVTGEILKSQREADD